MPSKPCRIETSSKEKRDAVHTFKQFLRRSHIPKSFLAVHFCFIPGGSCLPSPTQLSSCGVSTWWGTPPAFSFSAHFQNLRGWMGVMNKTKKADTRCLGQTDLIMDPGGAIKLTDYRFSISGVWAVWLLLCFHCISCPSFPCLLLEALHWSTSEVKQALARANSCLLLLLWKQL